MPYIHQPSNWTKPGLECAPFLDWQRQIRLCWPGKWKSKIVDLVWSGQAYEAQTVRMREEGELRAIESEARREMVQSAASVALSSATQRSEERHRTAESNAALHLDGVKVHPPSPTPIFHVLGTGGGVLNTDRGVLDTVCGVLDTDG